MLGMLCGDGKYIGCALGEYDIICGYGRIIGGCPPGPFGGSGIHPCGGPYIGIGMGVCDPTCIRVGTGLPDMG